MARISRVEYEPSPFIDWGVPAFDWIWPARNSAAHDAGQLLARAIAQVKLAH